MLVHFIIASQLFVYVNVDLYVHTLMYWRKKGEAQRAEH